VTIDGYWIVNWIYWITVYTLYNTTQGWQRLLSLCSTATNFAEYLANTNSSGLQTRLSLTSKQISLIVASAIVACVCVAKQRLRLRPHRARHNILKCIDYLEMLRGLHLGSFINNRPLSIRPVRPRPTSSWL
jgi:hypothetical protein